MQPYKIEIYVYAESEDEAKEAQQAAYDFVRENYEQGIIVTARKVKEALLKFKDNFFLKQYLKI